MFWICIALYIGIYIAILQNFALRPISGADAWMFREIKVNTAAADFPAYYATIPLAAAVLTLLDKLTQRQYICYKVWDETIHPFPNFNGATTGNGKVFSSHTLPGIKNIKATSMGMEGTVILRKMKHYLRRENKANKNKVSLYVITHPWCA